MNFGVIKYITYIVIIIGLIVGRLKEITQQYIKTINEYIDGFLLPLENRPQLIRKDRYVHSCYVINFWYVANFKSFNIAPYYK